MYLRSVVRSACRTIVAMTAVLSLPAVAADPDQDRQKQWIHERVWDTPFNEIAQVACHNCYESKYSGSFKAVLDHIRTIELDIHDQDSSPYLRKTKGNSWFVRHEAIEYPYTENNDNKNNCSGMIKDLEACLKDIQAWRAQNPGHFPITIVIDKKEAWGSEGKERSPQQLDNLFIRVFTGQNDLSKVEPAMIEANIFTPHDLAKYVKHDGSEPMTTFIAKRNWPTAGELKGKVILVLNQNNRWEHEVYFRTNRKARGETAKQVVTTPLMFISPPAQSKDEVTRPPQVGGEAASWVLMNNMEAIHADKAADVFAARHIGRVWGRDDWTFTGMPSTTDHIRNKSHLAAYYDFSSRYANGQWRIVPVGLFSL